MSVVDQLRAADDCQRRLKLLEETARELLDVLTGDLVGEQLYSAIEARVADVADALAPDATAVLAQVKGKTPRASAGKTTAKRAASSAPAKPTATEKYCPTCKETKPAEEFNRNASSPSGLQSHCRSCQRSKGRDRTKAKKAQPRKPRRTASPPPDAPTPAAEPSPTSTSEQDPAESSEPAPAPAVAEAPPPAPSPTADPTPQRPRTSTAPTGRRIRMTATCMTHGTIAVEEHELLEGQKPDEHTGMWGTIVRSRHVHQKRCEEAIAKKWVDLADVAEPAA